MTQTMSRTFCVTRFVLDAKAQHDSGMHIGQVVRKLRLQHNMTLEELASKVDDYDAGNLSRFEIGKQGIKLDKLSQIADVFGMRSSEILKLSEQETNRAEESIAEYRAKSLPDDPLVQLVHTLSGSDRELAISLLTRLSEDKAARSTTGVIAGEIETPMNEKKSARKSSVTRKKRS